jgi:diguanylate cyclase
MHHGSFAVTCALLIQRVLMSPSFLPSHYEPLLVLVSILVAILASYTALSLSERVTRSQGTASQLWIAGGAVAMGMGIWSMHFIGMLAFRLPIAIGFDFGITLVSLFLPILVSGMALWQVSQPRFPLPRLLAGALLMGAGINAMHYTGMAAMRMQPGIYYDPWLFVASVLIAIVASGTALWIAFRLRGNTPNVWLPRTGAAIVMGFAIVGMHYTGMAAANFPANSICLAAKDGFSPDSLAVMVAIATMAVLSIAMLASIYDAKLDLRSRRLAVSEAAVEERQVLLQNEREARIEAERLSEMKDEFLATVSHELRTPLSAILGWVQLLQAKPGDTVALGKGLETIERNARLQAQLIDDLLDMSRIIAGKISVDMQHIDLQQCVRAAIDTVRPAAMAKNITLDVFTAIVPAPILGDPNRLQQVFWNLLSNAVKFTPAGGTVTITVQKEQRELVVKVTDTGIGIAPGFLPHVFARFRQADASTTRRFGGLGLGLSIVKQLVELHGGTVAVASPGEAKGSSFTVRFPAVAEAAQATHSPVDAGSGQNGQLSLALTEKSAAVDLRGISVLVLDDQADALELVERVLRSHGARVIMAASANEGISVLQPLKPDVIVSDIGMPDIDGYDFMRQLRMLGKEQGGQIPAIALTAFSRAEDQVRAIQAGYNTYLAKPFNPEELVIRVAGLVGRHTQANP